MVKVFSLLLLASPVFGEASTYSQIACFTKSGSLSVGSIPSSTIAKTIYPPAIRKTTIVSSKTVTPKALTETTTLSATSIVTETAPQKTDTFTATLILSDTTTFSEIATITTTTVQLITTTSGDGTTTIPTSSGFVPIKSISGNPVAKRQRNGGALVDIEDRANKAGCKLENGKLTFFGPKSYPTAVTCQKLVEIVSTKTVTFTAKDTKTITLPAPTSIAKTTSTILSTTTVIPVNADNTVTKTTSTLISTTTTATSTLSETISNTVVEVPAPTATVYAACSADNIARTANGGGIYAIDYTGVDSEQTVTVNSAYDCCVQCTTSSNCGSSYFYNGRCYMLMVNTCPASGSLGKLVDRYFSGQNVPEAVVVSNGNCGYSKFGGG